MFYPEDIRQKLEFDKVLALLENLCISSLGRREIAAVSFSTDPGEISLSLSLAMEFKALIEGGEAFPYENYYDCRPSLRKLETPGSHLSESELFEIKLSLETIGRIRSLLLKKEEELYPALRSLSASADCFPAVTERISATLDKYGRVQDRASEALYEIRREKQAVGSSISKNIKEIMARAIRDGYAEEGSGAVVRGGRLVIPLTPAYKKRLSGIVHDESASGKTVYVEPAEIVEANNRVRSLEAAEEREVLRILRECSDFLRPMAPEMAASYDFLGQIDAIRAKAKFAIDADACMPTISDDRISDLRSARHPLLYLSLERQGRELVPLDLKLDEGCRMLLISGPNAGGKSVCLKTVGLLQYMLQCGLPVPASADSVMGLYDDIFIDIGDEQSIENDLSTYSSHLAAMKFFLSRGSGRSLLLIDEFGSGTEPVIGGAIAEAELEEFNALGCFGIITTHYSNLKHFAQGAEGMKNAAMLYDRGSMSPLFKLEIGSAGSSFAIEMARKAGISERIIESAVKKAGEQNINYDKNLQDIARDKRYWENKRQQARLANKKLQEKSEELDRRLEEVKGRKREIIEEARNEAAKILKDANAAVEAAIREIRESSAEKTANKHARETLRSAAEAAAGPREKAPQKKPAEKKELREGDPVKYGGNVGTLLKIEGSKAIVAFGQIEARVSLGELQRAKQSELNKQERISFGGTVRDDVRRRNLNFRSEIDVRGMRADEALRSVTSFIDDAVVVGASELRVLHGTGTGALRQEIRRYLSTLPYVKSFRDEHVQLGGAGITVIELE